MTRKSDFEVIINALAFDWTLYASRGRGKTWSGKTVV